METLRLIGQLVLTFAISLFVINAPYTWGREIFHDAVPYTYVLFGITALAAAITYYLIAARSNILGGLLAALGMAFLVCNGSMLIILNMRGS